MGFTARIAAAARALAAPATASGANSFIAETGPPNGPAPRRHSASLEASYRELPWINAVVGRLANGVASQRAHLHVAQGDRGRRRAIVRDVRSTPEHERPDQIRGLVRAGDLVEIDRHPLLSLIHDGNPIFTGYDNRRLLSIYLDLVGEGWLYLQRNAAGVPSSSLVIPPSWVKEPATPENPFHVVRFGRLMRVIPAADMLRFHNPDPSNPYGRGSGTAASLADELSADEYAARHISKWFFGGGRPDMIVTGEELPEKAPQVSAMEEKWLSKARNRLPIFLRGKSIEAKQIGHSFDQQQVVELRRFGRDMQAQVFGYPPELLGILGNSNRSTIQLADEINARNNLVPRLIRIRETYARLLPQYKGAEGNAILSFDNPIAKDREFALKVARTQPHVLTGNDWRRMADLDPVEGGDVHLVANRFVAWTRLDEVELRVAADPNEDGGEDRIQAVENGLDELRESLDEKELA